MYRSNTSRGHSGNVLVDVWEWVVAWGGAVGMFLSLYLLMMLLGLVIVAGGFVIRAAWGIDAIEVGESVRASARPYGQFGLAIQTPEGTSFRWGVSDSSVLGIEPREGESVTVTGRGPGEASVSVEMSLPDGSSRRGGAFLVVFPPPAPTPTPAPRFDDIAGVAVEISSL